MTGASKGDFALREGEGCDVAWVRCFGGLEVKGAAFAELECRLR